PNVLFGKNGTGLDGHPLSYEAVTDHHSRLDQASFTQPASAAYMDIGINDGVRTDLYAGLDINCRGIDHCDPGKHEFTVYPVPKNGSGDRKLHPVVHPHYLFRLIGMVCETEQVFFSGCPDYIGQIILSLGIIIFQAGNRIEQEFRRYAVYPRVYLRNLLFFRSCILFLYYPVDPSAFPFDDSSVSERVLDASGKDRDCRTLAVVCSEHR